MRTAAFYPHTTYSAKAMSTHQCPTLAQLHEMVNGYRDKAPLPFTVVCENVKAFMDSRTPRERLLMLNAYATIRENPELGKLGMEPGLYGHPTDRIYYHIVTPPGD